MKIAIYQIDVERDSAHVAFRDLNCITSAYNGRIPTGLYDCVFLVRLRQRPWRMCFISSIWRVPRAIKVAPCPFLMWWPFITLQKRKRIITVSRLASNKSRSMCVVKIPASSAGATPYANIEQRGIGESDASFKEKLVMDSNQNIRFTSTTSKACASLVRPICMVLRPISRGSSPN